MGFAALLAERANGPMESEIRADPTARLPFPRDLTQREEGNSALAEKSGVSIVRIELCPLGPACCKIQRVEMSVSGSHQASPYVCRIIQQRISFQPSSLDLFTQHFLQ
jgi:hypothetical protein